jgi:hypothetical protein
MSEPSPSLGCSGSARLLLGQARARVEPDFAARARLDKVGIELELESSPKLGQGLRDSGGNGLRRKRLGFFLDLGFVRLREKFPKIVRLREKVTRS